MIKRLSSTQFQTQHQWLLLCTYTALQNVLHGVDSLLTPAAAAAASTAKRTTTPSSGRRMLLSRALLQNWVGTNYPAFNEATMGYYQG
jgi:hypothetical protein